MEVDQVVHNATLKVVLDAVDDDLLPHVHNFEVSVVILVAVLVQAFVDLLVVANAVTEIQSRLFWVLAPVVRAGCLDVPDIAHDEGLLVAFRLDEHDLNALLGNCVHDPFSALFGAVGRIEYAHRTASSEPCQHIGHGRLCGGPSLSLALWVVDIEEVRGRLSSIFATIVAYIECLGRDRQPTEISLGW